MAPWPGRDQEADGTSPRQEGRQRFTVRRTLRGPELQALGVRSLTCGSGRWSSCFDEEGVAAQSGGGALERWTPCHPQTSVLSFPSGPAAWSITYFPSALNALAFYQLSFVFDGPPLAGADDNIRFKAQVTFEKTVE